MTLPKTLRTPKSLSQAGLVTPETRLALERVAARYAVAVTPLSAALIDPDDPQDPIALQFIPQARELDVAGGETADPIGDAAHSPLEGVVHRYPDRVLLTVTHVCATYCRFCFRREVVGKNDVKTLSSDALAMALAYIAEHTEIWEVILTGGDPLILSDARLARIMEALSKIDHVKVIRVHTRIPAVAPERVTPGLLAALKRSRKAVFVALHANHPRELTDRVREACGRIIDAGVPMISQTVLLKGVNDDPETLGALMRAFVETRIKPYYLHHGDRAFGTAHLRSSIDQGQHVMRDLRGRFSGLCQPTFVLDIPGGRGKVPIGPGYLRRDGGELWVEDPWGRETVYPPD